MLRGSWPAHNRLPVFSLLLFGYCLGEDFTVFCFCFLGGVFVLFCFLSFGGFCCCIRFLLVFEKELKVGLMRREDLVGLGGEKEHFQIYLNLKIV